MRVGPDAVRRRCPVVLGVCLALALGSLACSGDIRAAPPPERVVDIPNLSFAPAVISIPSGTTVRWRFLDEGTTHNVTIQGAGTSGDRRSGATFTHRFGRKGNYRYDCTLHPSMQGLIRVTDSAPGGDRSFPIEDDGPAFRAALIDEADMPHGFTRLTTPVIQASEPPCPHAGADQLPAPRIERKVAFRRGSIAAVQEVALHPDAGGRRFLDQLWKRLQGCTRWTPRRRGLGEVHLRAAKRTIGGSAGTISYELWYSAKGRPLRATTVVAQHHGVVSTIIIYGPLAEAEQDNIIHVLHERLIDAVKGV